MSLNEEALKIYQVDTFTNKAFKGNPAGVCILNKPVNDEIMQAIASEMNLSETAFLLNENERDTNNSNTFSLRWFTPEAEVPLCGHATLATSAVLFNEFNIKNEIIYETKSGKLVARSHERGIVLDFPLDEALHDNFYINEKLLEAMGISQYKTIFLGKKTKKLVIHLENYQEILKLNPNFELMKQLDVGEIKGVGVTAKIDGDYDFITRYFNPWAGVNEDSVTGSVHTLLASYWADILKKHELKAYQASRRGGEMMLKIKDKNRLEIIGDYVIVLKGELSLSN